MTVFSSCPICSSLANSRLMQASTAVTAPQYSGGWNSVSLYISAYFRGGLYGVCGG